MPNVSEYLVGAASEFVPNSLGSRLKSLGLFDQIASVDFFDATAATAALNERVGCLRHSMKITNRSASQNSALPSVAIIFIEIYWARESDLVLWAEPQSVWHDHAILFHAYSEFVRWTQWRLRACLGCTAYELTRIGLELGSLRRQRP